MAATSGEKRHAELVLSAFVLLVLNLLNNLAGEILFAF
jgi:hypothetical protein